MDTLRDTVVTFSPGLHSEDPVADYWLSQVTLRLRREVAWLWHERGVGESAAEVLPPTIDALSESLDLSRYWEAKCRFFAEDSCAAYLSECLRAVPPRAEASVSRRGSFSWVVHSLGLDPAACFVLALALYPTFDHAARSVFATCSNDASAVLPTMALAQRLWERPAEVLRVADPGHILFRYGLVTRAGASGFPPSSPGSSRSSVHFSSPERCSLRATKPPKAGSESRAPKERRMR